MFVRAVLISGLILLCLVGIGNSQSAQAAAAASPVYSGIVVDCSGSQRLQMDKVVNLIKHYVEAMQDDDQAFVVRYVDAARISIVQDLTKERSDLNDAAEALYVEGGQTAMVDAVVRAAGYFAKNKPAESDGVLILISNGEDRGSGKSVEEAISSLKDQKIRVFAIAMSDLKVSTKLLDKLTKDTGGKTFTPRTSSDLSNAVLEITKTIRGVTASK